MKKILATLATALMVSAGAQAAFLPKVGNGTSPNVWTRNMDGVLAAAKTTGYPIMLVMINEGSGGDGCSHCRDFIANTINTSHFTSIVNDNTFYMVLLNWYGVHTGVMSPDYGDVSAEYFDKYWYKYTVDTGYPLVAVIKPDGTRYKAWTDTASKSSGNYSTKAPNFHTVLRAAIEDLSVKNTVLAMSADTSNALSVMPGAPATWQGRVTRSGGSGKTGTVNLALSGGTAGSYALNPSSLGWGTGDGAQTFTLTGPYTGDDGIIFDTVTVSMSASGFNGSRLSYGNTAETITFRDARVKQTLGEFSASSGIATLTPNAGVWYVPSDGGNVLETYTTGTSAMTWTAAQGGYVTFASSSYVPPAPPPPPPATPDIIDSQYGTVTEGATSGAWIVTVTNDITGPVEITNTFGTVSFDLNGYNISQGGHVTFASSSYVEPSPSPTPPATIPDIIDPQYGEVTWDATSDTWVVTVTNNITGPVEITNTLGNVVFDLNGFTISGADGDATNPDGGVAVHIVPAEGGTGVNVSFVDNSGIGTTIATITGGKGADGTADHPDGYDGGAGILIDKDVTNSVVTVIGPVKVVGGTGGAPVAGNNEAVSGANGASVQDDSGTDAGGSEPEPVVFEDKGSFVVTFRGQDYDLSHGYANGYETLTLAVSAGEAVTFTATKPQVANGYAKVGLSQFSFDPLVPVITAPANGASISYPAMMADKSLVNLAWGANKAGCSFDVLDAAGNVLVRRTTATSANGIDIGLVSTAEGSANYTWRVRAYYNDPTYGEVMSETSSSFLVASVPKFGAMPTSVTAYLKMNTSFDFSAKEGVTDGVTYSASGLPKGLSINAKTGVISGKPTKTGTSKVTVTAANPYGSASVVFTLKVEKISKAVKGNFAIMLFNGAQNIVSSGLLKTTTSGKWSLKVTAANGSTKTLKGTMAAGTGGTIIVSGSGVSLTGSTASGVWTGSVNGQAAYGARIAKVAKSWQGIWNSGVGAAGAPAAGGYVTAKVSANGKVAFSGKTGNKYKISGSGYGALLPAAVVAAHLPRWAGHGNVLFAHLNKKRGANGGYALCGDGTVDGYFTFNKLTYNSVRGSHWSKTQSLASLNGATLTTTGGTAIAFPVKATATSVSAGSNKVGARVKAVKAKGSVTFSYKSGRTKGKGTGVLFIHGGRLQGAGGGNSGKTIFSFTID